MSMIGVLAATGFTGRLVSCELKKAGLKFFLAARNATALERLSEELGGVESRVLNVKDPSTFATLDGCTVLINCAGPFIDLGEPIVQACIARKTHYLDLTGEQSFIKLVYEKYHEQAKSAGICLVPACAFEYAIGDALGKQLFSTLPGCNQIDLVYHMEGMYTSAGTRKSIIRALAANGYRFRNGRIESSSPAAQVKSALVEGKRVSLVPFPAGESLMLPRHIEVQNINTYMSMHAPAFLLPFLAGIGQTAMKIAGDFLVNTVSTAYPTVEQRQSTKFIIRATAKNPAGEKSASVAGTDPYWLTAVIVAGVADYLARHGCSSAGAITPSMAGKADLIRDLSTQAGCVWKD